MRGSFTDGRTNVLNVYGASDDLIEIEGDISEEFNLVDDDKGDLLAFSDGTVLRIAYTNPGIWRITPVVRGTATLSIDAAMEDDDVNYTDKATLDGDVVWVAHAVAYARKR
jgi:hypothetical protein